MTTDKRTRGAYRKTESRRADILRAAIDSIAEHGYDRASLRDIAARAGISHAGLLHHFADKDDLLHAAMRKQETDDHEFGIAAAEAGASVPTIVSDILARAAGNPDAARSWLALTVAASRPDHPAHDFFAGRRARARAAFTEGTAVLPADDAGLSLETTVVLLVALTDGLLLQSLYDPTLDVANPLKRFFELVWPSAGATMPARPVS